MSSFNYTMHAQSSAAMKGEEYFYGVMSVTVVCIFELVRLHLLRCNGPALRACEHQDAGTLYTVVPVYTALGRLNRPILL